MIHDAEIASFDGVCQEQLYVFARSRWPAVKQEPVLFTLDGAVRGALKTSPGVVFVEDL